MKKELNKILILTVAHKPFKQITQDSSYQVIYVGKKNGTPIGSLRDDSQKNIASKNPFYCELTAIYWAWKNLCDLDYIGITHYRRYFQEPQKNSNKTSKILTGTTALSLLKNFDIIIPRKKIIPSFNIYTHYSSHHYKKDLKIIQKIINETTPEYTPSFNHVMRGHSLCLYNMFVTSTKILDEYCTWLFPILSEAENKINTRNYSTTQKRVFGFLAERLFNVWLHYHSEYTIAQLNVISFEEKHPSLASTYNKILRRLTRQKL